MTRNHLLKLSLQPRPSRVVWRMTLDLIGQAFGVRSTDRREPGR